MAYQSYEVHLDYGNKKLRVMLSASTAEPIVSINPELVNRSIINSTISNIDTNRQNVPSIKLYTSGEELMEYIGSFKSCTNTTRVLLYYNKIDKDIAILPDLTLFSSAPSIDMGTDTLNISYTLIGYRAPFIVRHGDGIALGNDRRNDINNLQTLIQSKPNLNSARLIELDIGDVGNAPVVSPVSISKYDTKTNIYRTSSNNGVLQVLDLGGSSRRIFNQDMPVSALVPASITRTHYIPCGVVKDTPNNVYVPLTF